MTRPRRGCRSALALRAALVAVPLLLAACGGSPGTSTSTPPGTSSTPHATTTHSHCIPQNFGGDDDADNDGGSSDGDGCT